MIVAVSACLSLAVVPFAAERKFYVPSSAESARGNTFDETWKISYDKGSKTLTFEAESPSREVPNAYLLSTSTDSVSNRFIDLFMSEDPYPAMDLQYFSSDLIRFGKAKKVLLKNKNKIEEEYDFETKNNRVTSSIHSEGYGEDKLTKDRKHEFIYNKQGNVTRITETYYDRPGLSPETYEFKYDSQNRPKGCVINSSEHYTFTGYDNHGWPTTIKNSDGAAMRKVILDSNGRLTQNIGINIDTGEGNQPMNYYYDSQGRLVNIYWPPYESYSGGRIVFSGYYII